jgi:hypothetical protein
VVVVVGVVVAAVVVVVLLPLLVLLLLLVLCACLLPGLGVSRWTQMDPQEETFFVHLFFPSSNNESDKYIDTIEPDPHNSQDPALYSKMCHYTNPGYQSRYKIKYRTNVLGVRRSLSTQRTLQ